MAVAGFVSFPALLFNFFVWLGGYEGEAGCYCRIVNVGIASPPIGISTTKKLKFLNICRIFTFYGEYFIYDFIWVICCRYLVVKQ